MRNKIFSIGYFLLLIEISFGQEKSLDPFRSDPAANRIQSVQFVDAPITDVFTMISDLTGWSIVMSPEVSAKPPKINLWIKNLTPDQVLDQVLQLAELVRQREGGLIKVMTFDEYTRLYGLEKKVIPLQYATAPDIVEVLKPFADKATQAKILADPGGNKVILLVPKPLLESLEHLVSQLDTPFEKDEIVLIPLQHLEAAVLAPALEDFLIEEVRRKGTSRIRSKEETAPRAEGAEITQAGESWLIQFMVEPKLNVLVLRGYPQDVKRAVDLIHQLDVPSEIQTIGYELQYTSARDAYTSLQEIVKEEQQQRGRDRFQVLPRLRISPSQQNNRIIVEGSPQDHARIAQIIAAIDKPLPPGSGGLRVYRLENASSANVVKVIQDLVTARQEMAKQTTKNPLTAPVSTPGSPATSESAPASAPGSTTTEATTSGSTAGDIIPAVVLEAPEINAVIIKASAVEQEEFAQIIQELDLPRDQVVLEVTLVAVRSTNGFNLGIELAGAYTDSATQSIALTNYGIGAIDPATGDIRISNPPPSGLSWAIFNSQDFSLVLNAIKTVGQTRITSSPKILIEDNGLARLNQLSQEPYETSSQGENSTITSFGGYSEAGTVLNIIPHIASQDWLRLEYEIQFSSFGTRTAEQLAANLPPPRQQNLITGTVRIPAEHTIVLGGQISSRHDKVTDSVPFISDIPLIGELFKNRTDDQLDETLFVFIQPTVLGDPEFQDLMFISDRDLRKADLFRQQELQNPLKTMTPEESREEGVIP